MPGNGLQLYLPLCSDLLTLKSEAKEPIKEEMVSTRGLSRDRKVNFQRHLEETYLVSSSKRWFKAYSVNNLVEDSEPYSVSLIKLLSCRHGTGNEKGLKVMVTVLRFRSGTLGTVGDLDHMVAASF